MSDHLPCICPRCGAAYASQWAVEECAREDNLADLDTRRGMRRHG